VAERYLYNIDWFKPRCQFETFAILLQIHPEKSTLQEEKRCKTISAGWILNVSIFEQAT
jgi:hypothetical protein